MVARAGFVAMAATCLYVRARLRRELGVADSLARGHLAHALEREVALLRTSPFWLSAPFAVSGALGLLSLGSRPRDVVFACTIAAVFAGVAVANLLAARRVDGIRERLSSGSSIDRTDLPSAD